MLFFKAKDPNVVCFFHTSSCFVVVLVHKFETFWNESRYDHLIYLTGLIIQNCGNINVSSFLLFLLSL